MEKKFETQLNTEDKISTEKKQDDSKMSRREFIKYGAAAAGSVLLGGVLGESMRSEREISKEHEQHGYGVVTEKIFRPGDPYRWRIRIRLDINNSSKDSVISVHKREFDNLEIGEKVSVSYDDRDMSINSIENK